MTLIIFYSIVVFLCWCWCDVVSASAAGAETLIGITGNGFILLAADSTAGGGYALTSSTVDKIYPLDNDKLIAAAGDSADVDQLLGQLRAACAMATYEGDSGATFIDCSSDNKTGADPGAAASVKTSSPATNAAGLTVDCVAEAARYSIWQRLRSQQPIRACLLVAGLTSRQQHAAGSGIERVVQRQVDLATASLTPRESSIGVANHSNDGGLQPALFWLDEYGALQRVSYAAHGMASTLLWSVLDRGYKKNMNVDEAVELLKECLTQLKTRYAFSTNAQFCVKCLDGTGCRVIQLDKTKSL